MALGCSHIHNLVKLLINHEEKRRRIVPICRDDAGNGHASRAAKAKYIGGGEWLWVATSGVRPVLVLARIESSDRGEVPERSNGAVSKTVVPLTGDRGFESLPLRQSPFNRL